MSRIDLKDIHPIKAQDLLDKEFKEDPAYIGPCILPHGSKLLFGGLSKIGKSLLCLEFARGLITGTPPFDCPKLYVPKPVNVLYLEAEIGEEGVQNRINNALQGLTIEEKNRLNIVAKIRTIGLEDHRHVDEVVRLVNEAEASVLIIDPISKIHHYNENDNMEMQRLFERLDEIQDKADSDLAIVLSHHFSKPPRETHNSDFDDLSFNNFRGAGKLAADPDTLVTVKVDDSVKIPGLHAWALRTRWVTRQGIPALEDNAKLEVYRNENGRVLYVPDERLIIPKLRPRKQTEPTISLDTVNV